MENNNIAQTHISWKKKIKDLQILFFVILGVGYYVYGTFQQTYSNYESVKQEYNDITTKKLVAKEMELKKTQEKTKSLYQVYKSKKNFIEAYNKCFRQYAIQNYGVRPKDGVIKSLPDCIAKKITDGGFIKKFSDEDIKKIAIGFGVKKSKMPKFNVDQKALLMSLDKNIFNDKLESATDFLTISSPSVIDKKLNLYKSSFSISVELSFNEFKELLKKLQINLYENNNMYYNITSVSTFDISNPNEKQKISIQGTFYFTK